MSDSVRPHRRQPSRLPHPWDSQGTNAGVGCHFLLQCIKVKSASEITQSCPTVSDPMDCSPPGSSIHEVFQAGVLEWGAIAFSKEDMARIQKKNYTKKIFTTQIIMMVSSLRLTSIDSMMPSSHLILCRPLLLLPPIPPSIRA